MVIEQNKQTITDEEKRESGMPGGGQGRVDEVGKSGVYPVSEMDGASDNAVTHGESSFGQGKRGAAGYEDSGTSELIYLDEEGKTAGAQSGSAETSENSEDIVKAKTQGGEND